MRGEAGESRRVTSLHPGSVGFIAQVSVLSSKTSDRGIFGRSREKTIDCCDGFEESARIKRRKESAKLEMPRRNQAVYPLTISIEREEVARVNLRANSSSIAFRLVSAPE